MSVLLSPWERMVRISFNTEAATSPQNSGAAHGELGRTVIQSPSTHRTTAAYVCHLQGEKGNVSTSTAILPHWKSPVPPALLMLVRPPRGAGSVLTVLCWWAEVWAGSVVLGPAHTALCSVQTRVVSGTLLRQVKPKAKGDRKIPNGFIFLLLRVLVLISSG